MRDFILCDKIPVWTIKLLQIDILIFDKLQKTCVPFLQSFPVQPGLQSQWNDPSLLMHVPLLSHGKSVSHSFLSRKEGENLNIVVPMQDAMKCQIIVPRGVRNSKGPKTWQVQEWMVSAFEQIQVPNHT